MKKIVVFILFFVFVGNSSALGATDYFGNQIPENYLPFSFSAGSFAPDPNFSVMPKKYSGCILSHLLCQYVNQFQIQIA